MPGQQPGQQKPASFMHPLQRVFLLYACPRGVIHARTVQKLLREAGVVDVTETTSETTSPTAIDLAFTKCCRDARMGREAQQKRDRGPNASRKQKQSKALSFSDFLTLIDTLARNSGSTFEAWKAAIVTHCAQGPDFGAEPPASIYYIFTQRS